METFLWSLAILLAIGAGLIGILVLFRILSSTLSASFTVVGYIIKSFVQLIFSTLVDIRILALIAIIFTMMANYERGKWLWPSFAMASSLFVIAASYVIIFFLDAVDRGLFVRADSESRDGEFWAALKHLIFLNIGFLGIFYIILSFSLVSYSYFLLSTYDHELPWVFAGPACVSFSDFASYTGQTALEAIPLGAAKKLGISISTIEIRKDAYTFNAFVLIFQILLYSAVLSFIAAILKLRRTPRA